MTLEFQTTPLQAGNGFELPDTHHRGIALDPALRPAFAGVGRGAENIDRLFDDAAVCVTSGQQPGLFTGPLFTLYKALSAVALAREYEAALGRSVVPVFWVAGDDHDFAEANHVTLLSTSNEPERLELPARAADGPSTPLYREAFGSDIEGLIERATALLPDTEFRTDAMAWLTRHYHAGNDMATAFGDALAELLGSVGLVVFRPTHAAAKAVSAPWMIKALEAGTILDERLQARAEELEAAGHALPVATQAGNTLVMVDAKMGRDRLTIDGADFVTRRSGERWTLASLRELAAVDPERLSANVLLRPVIEAAILPTMAYVAGPSELAYFPQTVPVFETLGVAPQVFVPRWSARIIESRVRKTLDRYGLTPEDLTGPEGQIEAQLVQDAMPSDAAGALHRLRNAVDEEFTTLVAGGKDIDQTLEKPIEHIRNQMKSGLDHVEKKLISRLKQQNEVLVRQLANARHAVFPTGRPQERVFNVLQYLVKYGPDFVEQAQAHCDAWAKALEPLPRS